MVTYMPILKGREGEFRAFTHLPASLVWHILPIFEVVPTGNGPIKDAYRFGNQARESVPADLTIAVDVRHLSDPTEGVRRPLRDIADDLAAWGIPMLPVLQSSSSSWISTCTVSGRGQGTASRYSSSLAQCRRWVNSAAQPRPNVPAH
ncbi:hypothetical protein AB0C50_10230 [Micromonospora taraxaci]|uniref:beta family protein n=1 Tax=Micromonospora taraxaci TaxID=1316803 RepID=UPI0033E07112